MNLFKSLKKIIYDACLYFTIAEFFILIIATLIGDMAPANGGEVGKFLSLSASATVLLAAIIMSALNLVWKMEASGAVKLIIHFIGSLATFAILFIIIPGVFNNVTQVIVRSAVFAAIYFLIALVVLIVLSIRHNKNSEKLEYENKFDKN